MKNPKMLAQVEKLREARDDLEERIDRAISEYVSFASKASPGVPLTSLRHMLIDARASGAYSYGAALERLHHRLLEP